MFNSNINKVDLIYEIKPNIVYTNIILLDYLIKDIYAIYNAANETTLPIIYNYSSSKIDLDNLLDSLAKTSNLRLCICFTSYKNNIKPFLDNKLLTAEENEIFIKNLLTKYNVNNLDFLACNIFNYLEYRTFYSKLKEHKPDLDIGASNDKTGNIK